MGVVVWVRPNRTPCKNQQLQFALASTAVYLETGNFNTERSLRCAHIGRAESVSVWAYQCLRWGVSNHALRHFVLDGSCAAQPQTAMKRTKRTAQIQNGNQLDSLAQVMDGLKSIVTLAELLQGYSEGEWTKPEVVVHAGMMISRSADQLSDLLRQMDHHGGDHPSYIAR
jgi:hypothetical protein